jgi:hypothetical protein
MTTYKTVNNDYTITCDDGTGIFTVNAQTVFNGNVTYTVPAVTDFAFTTVAANNTGAITDGGLLMQTGPTTFAGLRFDVTSNTWQISSSVNSAGAPVASYANIITTTSAAVAAGSNTQIQFNNNGAFGATANLSFDTATNKLFLSGHQVFANTSTPANVANAVTLYSNVVGGGGTGLYFTSASANDELVSKGKAIVYGIIF